MYDTVLFDNNFKISYFPSSLWFKDVTVILGILFFNFFLKNIFVLKESSENNGFYKSCTKQYNVIPFGVKANFSKKNRFCPHLHEISYF